MEDKNQKLQLCIANEETLSGFVIELIKDEAQVINEQINILDGEIKIRTSYIHESEDKIEVGLYIINNLSKKINFENLSLCLVKDGIDVGNQVFQSKELGDIPAKTIKYNCLYFNRSNVKISNFDGVEVKFDTDERYQAKRTINIELADLPNTIEKNDLKIIKTYLKELPYLDVDTIDINTFSVVYDEHKNLCMVIVIRNGWKSDVKLEILPVKIYDSKDNLVYSGTFKLDNINIKAKIAVLQSIVVPKENIQVKDADLSKFRVEFK